MVYEIYSYGYWGLQTNLQQTIFQCVSLFPTKVFLYHKNKV